MRRAAGLAAVAIAVATLASACVSIPETSPVYQGQDVGVDNDPQQVRINVTGPASGADPESVVQGFYRAMLAYPQNVPVAQKFLTPQAAGDWDPDASVVVYQNIDTVSTGTVPKVSVTGRALGSVDERGSWVSALDERSAMDTTLRLVRIRGEWRIANPRPGIFVDSDYFERNYSDYSLYFFDPTRQVLTPDPVYLAVGDTTATALIRDLLLGPTSHLTGVAETIAPTSTEVDVAVEVSTSGVADIPLSDAVLRLSPEDRRLFAAQVTWTLRQLDDIRSISISVERQPLEIPNVGLTFATDEYAAFNPAGLAGERRLFAFDEDGVVAVSPGAATPALGPIRDVPPGASLAVDISGQLGAVVRNSRRSVVVAGLPGASNATPQAWFRHGTALLRPSWDLQGVLWLVDHTAKGARIYAVTKDAVRAVHAPGLAGADVTSFAVSRDGVRFAAVVGTGEGSQLQIATVDRAPQTGGRVRLQSPRQVRGPLVDLVDFTKVAWSSPTSLAVLANERGADRKPYELAIDGSKAAAAEGFLSVVPRTIAAGPDTDTPLVIGAAGGLLYLQTLGSWSPFPGAEHFRAPVYPG